MSGRVAVRVFDRGGAPLDSFDRDGAPLGPCPAVVAAHGYAHVYAAVVPGVSLPLEVEDRATGTGWLVWPDGRGPARRAGVTGGRPCGVPPGDRLAAKLRGDGGPGGAPAAGGGAE